MAIKIAALLLALALPAGGPAFIHSHWRASRSDRWRLAVECTDAHILPWSLVVAHRESSALRYYSIVLSFWQENLYAVSLSSRPYLVILSGAGGGGNDR